MLRRIWRWLSSLFFGSKKNYARGRSPRLATENQAPLTDTDYEFLFNELLEGVAHGWHQGRIIKFFEQLGRRGNTSAWREWLERFGDRVLNSPSPNDELARRMLAFGQQVYSNHEFSEVGHIALTVGEQLLNKGQSQSSIWEYSGPDLGTVYPENEPPSSPEQVQSISVEQLFEALQNNPDLLKEVAQQIGVDSDDPLEIINVLIHKVNTLQPLKDEQNTNINERELFNLALRQANSGDFVGAIALWEQVLQLNPNISPAWHNRATALGSVGEWEEALKSFDQALQIAPEDYQTWNDRGNILYNLQRWEDALSSWDKVIEFKPDYYQAWYNRGCALENLGRLKEAITSYDQVLQLHPDFYLAESRKNNLLKKL